MDSADPGVTRQRQPGEAIESTGKPSPDTPEPARSLLVSFPVTPEGTALVRPALPLGSTGIGPDIGRAFSDPDSNEECRDEAIGNATCITAGHTAATVFGMAVSRVF
jgi:hypothetical protein